MRINSFYAGPYTFLHPTGGWSSGWDRVLKWIHNQHEKTLLPLESLQSRGQTQQSINKQLQFITHHSEVCVEKRNWYRLKTGRIRKEGQRRKGIQDGERQDEEGQLVLKKEHKISIVDVLGREGKYQTKSGNSQSCCSWFVPRPECPVFILYQASTLAGSWEENLWHGTIKISLYFPQIHLPAFTAIYTESKQLFAWRWNTVVTHFSDVTQWLKAAASLTIRSPTEGTAPGWPKTRSSGWVLVNFCILPGKVSSACP